MGSLLSLLPLFCRRVPSFLANRVSRVKDMEVSTLFYVFYVVGRNWGTSSSAYPLSPSVCSAWPYWTGHGKTRNSGVWLSGPRSLISPWRQTPLMLSLRRISSMEVIIQMCWPVSGIARNFASMCNSGGGKLLDALGENGRFVARAGALSQGPME